MRIEVSFVKPRIACERFDPETTPVPLLNGANGHLPGGRFAPGNRAAVGRKPTSCEWKQVGREAISLERLRAIFAAAARKAIGGDVPAMRFCAEYVIGRPKQRIDLLHSDYEEVDPSDDPGSDYFA